MAGRDEGAAGGSIAAASGSSSGAPAPRDTTRRRPARCAAQAPSARLRRVPTPDRERAHAGRRWSCSTHGSRKHRGSRTAAAPGAGATRTRGCRSQAQEPLTGCPDLDRTGTRTRDYPSRRRRPRPLRPHLDRTERAESRRALTDPARRARPRARAPSRWRPRGLQRLRRRASCLARTLPHDDRVSHRVAGASTVSRKPTQPPDPRAVDERRCEHLTVPRQRREARGKHDGRAVTVSPGPISPACSPSAV